MELKGLSVAVPQTPTTSPSDNTIRIDSVHHRSSPDHQSSMASLREISKKKHGPCEALRNCLFRFFSGKQQQEALAPTHVIGTKIFDSPSEVLKALNPSARTPESENINVRNLKGESVIYLLCKGENLSRVFTLSDGTRFIPSAAILRYILTNRPDQLRLDFEVRNLSDQGVLATTTPEMRMLIVNNTTVQDVTPANRYLPSFTFRGILEKMVIYSSIDWMDPDHLKEFVAPFIANEGAKKAYLEKAQDWITTEEGRQQAIAAAAWNDHGTTKNAYLVAENEWIMSSASLRKAYLNAAKGNEKGKGKVEEWPEKYNHQLEYPKHEHPLAVVVKYSWLPEWKELLNAMLEELDKPRRASPSGIRQHIATQLTTLSAWIGQNGSRYQETYDILSKCKFYQPQPQGNHVG